jgi:integrase
MAATNKLTDNKIKAIKPEDKPRKYADGGGMYLYVATSGSKLWRMAYRVDGKAQVATFGPYPLVSLSDARTKRDDFKRKLALGEPVITPKGPKKITLSEACATYWESRSDVTAGYRDKAISCLKRHIEPMLGNRALRDLTRADVLDALKPMDAKGLHDFVRKARMWLSEVFEWAIEHEFCEINPCKQIRPEKAFGKTPTQSYASIEITKVPAFMQRLAVEAELQSVLACKLLALTWTRTGELRKMKWGEIEGDVWRIPAANMKLRRDHIVPLPRQALDILEKMRQRSQGSEYVFPNDRRMDRPMSENSVLYLIHRMGYKGKMTGHGLRSVASTWANERGFKADAIERQLAHVQFSAFKHVAQSGRIWSVQLLGREKVGSLSGGQLILEQVPTDSFNESLSPLSGNGFKSIDASQGKRIKSPSGEKCICLHRTTFNLPDLSYRS